MKILLVAATEHELMVNRSERESGSTYNRPDILVAGIGIASTTYHLTKSLLQGKYNLVIQAGIAGTFTHELELGEVVLIKADTFADAGIEEYGSFKNLFAAGLADKNLFPFNDGWLINNALPGSSSLKAVKGVTVNKITDDKMKIGQQKAMYAAQAESMEGAALHYVCLQLGVPFLQIRSISNIVGERNKTRWKMKEAIGNLNSELQNIIETININS